MSSLFEFIKAVLKHWGILVTSGVGIGALGIWQGTGHYIPHWVYWSVAAIGLVGACYKAWDAERQQVETLAERQTTIKRDEQRELIRVLTVLRALLDDALRWRGIVKDKFGMAPNSVNLLPEAWPDVVFQAAKISGDLRTQVEAVGKTLAEANSKISEFLSAPMNYRNERLMPIAYQLLDEGVPRLSTVITEFEAYEKSLG